MRGCRSLSLPWRSLPTSQAIDNPMFNKSVVEPVGLLGSSFHMKSNINCSVALDNVSAPATPEEFSVARDALGMVPSESDVL
ncbi:hypothetical protein BDV19DRAFT_366696 [Aspergillus venezuelensis]